MRNDAQLIAALRGSLHELTGASSELDGLVALGAQKRLVLIGEASHGTHEFYDLRAKLTQRLIEEHGFDGVVVEADWPDAYRVNRWVRLLGDDRDAEGALGGFERRFPAWMWRNSVVLDFAGWLRARNESVQAIRRAGFWGMDLYSLYESIDEVLRYLARVDPEASERARIRYSCLGRLGSDAQEYGFAVKHGVIDACEDQVVQQLVELQRRVPDYARMDGELAEDEAFFAEQNARLVQNAEAYYRSMYRWGASSWNLRDGHMVDTVDALLAHLSRKGREARLVVWAHNSHLGDASATEMGRRGEHNVGQLLRQRHPGQCALIGFTTHDGTVTAAWDWGAAPERRNVQPSLAGSYERLFHDVGVQRFWLDLRLEALGEAAGALREERLERAIGVLYRPQTERQSHYFHASLPAQFDAVLHVDRTRALEPLERSAHWERGEPPETYPSGV